MSLRGAFYATTLAPHDLLGKSSAGEQSQMNREIASSTARNDIKCLSKFPVRTAWQVHQAEFPLHQNIDRVRSRELQSEPP
jgi:hypothetical protein